MKQFRGLDWLGPLSGSSLLRRFTLVSLSTTVVVGAVFGAVAVRVVEDYALRQRAHSAATYVTQFVSPRLVRQDFLAPAQQRVQFEFAFHDVIGKAGIIRATVWNDVGEVMYSSDPTLMGQMFPLSPAIRRALDGEIQSRLVRADKGPAGAQLMEVFVPVSVKGYDFPVGVYDVLSDIADVEPALVHLKWSIWASVALGILILYGALFTIVWKASQDLERQHEALRRAFAGTVRSLANAVDARDMATADHSGRVAEYAVAIAKEMGLGDSECREVQVAGFLHDVGKIGIHDDILAKKGPLTDVEWNSMRRHPLLGYEILQPVAISEKIKLAVRHSHEWWDGSGYPDGLAGKQIPLAARVIAVADTFESFTTDRPYRPSGDPRQAVEEILRCAGTQFDPRVVRAFVRVWEKSGVTVISRDQKRASPSRPRAQAAGR
ncbi:MAG TPA: HD-GYP domain-containing protein [bacterium]|nr:HD-GYP domain-containing protein [bacterium]